MAIELHCPGCSKMIRAPENAGGKRGKCPYCGGSVYIPMPPTEDDEIKIAPVDERTEKEREAMRREAIKYAADVDQAQGGKYDVGPPASGPRRAESSASADMIDVPRDVKNYILAMRDSNLDDAERIVARLRRRAAQARDYVEGLMLDQMGLSVKDVPPALTKGFLKTLSDRLK